MCIRSFKDRVEQLSTFENKSNQEIHLCLGDSKKAIKKNICAHLNDDFDAEK